MLPLVRVDGEHVLGAGPRGALHGVYADAAGAEDHHDVTHPHVAGIHRRAEPGRHAAAHQRRELHRDVVLDLHAGPFRQHRVLGERADHAHAAEVLAILVKPERLVLQAADTGPLAGVAQVLLAGGAIAALAADRDIGARDPVAHLHPGDTGPGLHHHASALMPADQRQPRHAPRADVLVGVAQAGRLHLDQHLVRLGRVQLKLRDLPRRARLAQHRGPGLHGCLRIGAIVSDRNC